MHFKIVFGPQISKFIYKVPSKSIFQEKIFRKEFSSPQSSLVSDKNDK